MSESTTAGPRPAEPATQDATIRPFRVSVPDEDLAELRRRLASARWPSRELVADPSQGVQRATLQALAHYWATDYDLQRIEARLNALPQFTTEINGVDIHFLHVKSPHRDALPLLITHFQTIIGRLDTKPAIIPGVTSIVELKGRGRALTIEAAGARSPSPPWPSSSAFTCSPLAWLAARP